MIWEITFVTSRGCHAYYSFGALTAHGRIQMQLRTKDMGAN